MYCRDCGYATIGSIRLSEQLMRGNSYRELKTNSIVCCAHANEEYIISFGGQSQPYCRGEFVRQNCTFVYDVNKKIMRKSAIECPTSVHVISMKNEKLDELMVFGFVNRCFASSEFQNIQRLPHYLIRLIAEWISNEWIYLIKERFDGNGEHWK